jgi:phosphatidylserine/phosphatidylglycerophosphate/cardiolipin synthase-like enzyme
VLRRTPNAPLTRRERAIIAACRTPRQVQRWLNALPYNHEKGGETLRSFRGVARRGTAHCLEAALSAATILEQHGYPPLLLSFESIDQLDHVLFAFRENGRWGAVARSRDPGLHGRKPVFATPRQLAQSYADAYVDLSGRVTGFAVADLRELGAYDWRLAPGNVWKVERWLIDYPHRRVGISDRRYHELHERYLRYKARYPDKKPVYYDNRHTWM